MRRRHRGRSSTPSIKVREVDRQIKDLEGKLASLAPRQHRRTEVKVALTAEAAAEADMVIRYQVTSASWTPFYDARLTVGSKAQAPKLQLVRRAAIKQHTGEVWDDVALALSTARPSAGTAAPLLRPVTIDFESEKVGVSYAPPPPSQAPAARGTGMKRRAEMEEIAADEEKPVRILAKQKTAAVEVQAFQAVYGIAGRTTVPDTGETKRVQIDEMSLDPTLMVRAVPKRDEKAYLYAKIVTAKARPSCPARCAVPRQRVRGQRLAAPAAAGGRARAGLWRRRFVRVRHALAEEKRRETGIISTSKTNARSYRVSVRPARAVDANHRHRPDPGVPETPTSRLS